MTGLGEMWCVQARSYTGANWFREACLASVWLPQAQSELRVGPRVAPPHLAPTAHSGSPVCSILGPCVAPWPSTYPSTLLRPLRLGPQLSIGYNQEYNIGCKVGVVLVVLMHAGSETETAQTFRSTIQH